MRNGISKVGGQWYGADNDGKLALQDVPTLVETYVSWAIGIAADNSHGYTQDARWGPDYDCASPDLSGSASSRMNLFFPQGSAWHRPNLRYFILVKA